MDKMRPWRFLWALTLMLPLTASNSRADCAACTKSHMVRIQMKFGAAEKGHLAWNSFYIEELLTGYGLQERVTARPLLKDWDRLDEQEAFARWVDMANLIVREKIPLRAPAQEPVLTLYRDLIEIEYPRKMNVVEEGAIVKRRLSDIVEIAQSADRREPIDTTGIPALSRADIALLKGKPRFWIEQEGSTGATVWAIYGKSIHLTDVLEHLMHVSGDSHGAISVNGVRITGRGDFAPADSGKSRSELGPLKTECEAFLHKLGSYERQQWKSMRADKSGRISGIVRFEYGWD